MTDTLWLVRHGNREDFVDEDWHKTADRPHDPDLSPDGVEQVRRTAEALRGEGIGAIYASPFLRTVHTAALVADVLGVPVLLEWGFAEWMNPDWFDARPETLPVAVLTDRFARIDTGRASRFDLSFPEERPAACKRAARTARALAEEAEGAVLLVGHGITVTGAAEGLTGRPGAFSDYPLCGLTKLCRDDDGSRDDAERWTAGPAASTTHLPDGAREGSRLN